MTGQKGLRNLQDVYMDYTTISEAQKLTGKSEKTLRRWLSRQTIDGVNIRKITRGKNSEYQISVEYLYKDYPKITKYQINKDESVLLSDTIKLLRDQVEQNQKITDEVIETNKKLLDIIQASPEASSLVMSKDTPDDRKALIVENTGQSQNDHSKSGLWQDIKKLLRLQ